MSRTLQNTVLRAYSRDDVIKSLDAIEQYADALALEMSALAEAPCDMWTSDRLSDSGLLGLMPTVESVRSIAGRVRDDLDPPETEPAFHGGYRFRPRKHWSGERLGKYPGE